eukprot:834185-Amphidinium_carterae.1
MDRDDTVATLTSADVGLDMSLTLERGAGWRFLAVGNLNASPARLSVTVKVWSKPCSHRLPKGRYRDLEERARRALHQDCQLQWVKAHQTRGAVDEGRITLEDFQGNLEADEVANLGAAALAAHEPSAEYLRWEMVAKAVRNFWLLVGPKLRECPEAWPRVRLPTPAVEEVVVPRLAGPGEPQPQAPHVEGPHRR